MKPLELTIFRPCACDEFCEVWVPADLEGPDIGNSGQEHFIRDKRLTDPELAAEYISAIHHFDTDWWQTGEDDEGLRAVAQTFERFATLPHYDEEER